MAHKKGQGATRNGRDSNAQFRGVKVFGGQQVNKVFADIGSTVDPTFGWPPFLDQVVTDWTETVGKSLTAKTDAVVALDQWQSRITTFAQGQGFTVR